MAVVGVCARTAGKALLVEGGVRVCSLPGQGGSEGMTGGLEGDDVVTNVGCCLSCSSIRGQRWGPDAVERVSLCSCIFMAV